MINYDSLHQLHDIGVPVDCDNHTVGAEARSQVRRTVPGLEPEDIRQPEQRGQLFQVDIPRISNLIIGVVDDVAVQIGPQFLLQTRLQ